MIAHFKRAGETDNFVGTTLQRVKEMPGVWLADEVYRVGVDRELSWLYFNGINEEWVYQLCAVVKRVRVPEENDVRQGTEEQDRRYYYVAYTCSSKGNWWRCDGTSVDNSSLKTAMSPDDGDVCLAFYQLQFTEHQEGKWFEDLLKYMHKKQA
jgi:hypothetical protein